MPLPQSHGLFFVFAFLCVFFGFFFFFFFFFFFNRNLNSFFSSQGKHFWGKNPGENTSVGPQGSCLLSLNSLGPRVCLTKIAFFKNFFGLT